MQGGRLEAWLERAGLGTRAARSWALYDWANSAMVTTIITAVFPVYFLKVAAGDLDPDEAQGIYARTTTFALVAIAVLAPFLGAIADARACKKLLLALFTGLGVAACAGMFRIEHGDDSLALTLFFFANVGAAGAVLFYDALLPHVAPPGKLDELSTSGYAFGYVGGGLLLALNLLWIKFPAWFGLPSGEGLTAQQETLPTRLAFLSVAVWWTLFSLPLLRRVPEPRIAERRSLGAALSGIRGTLRQLVDYPQTLRMLIAFLIYNDGIVTIIRMAVAYATAKEFGELWMIGTILGVQFAGIPFAFLFGRLSTRFGTKPLILGGLVVYVGICVFGYFMVDEWHFVALGLLVAMVQGGTQGLSRSLFGSMVPAAKSGEFFAFFAMGEKFAGIGGPLLYWLMIELTGSAQRAILSVSVFFLVGGWLLTTVDVEEGRRRAQSAT